MIIKAVNNLGTTLYTIFFGKAVGQDEFGNRYFVSKRNALRKWVLYKNEKDPTIIPVNWQQWLTGDNNEKPPYENRPNVKYTWEKSRMQNNTGTSEAYHPAKVLKKEQVSNKQKKYKSWQPN
jgi:NADH dehydrogenase